MLGLGVTFPPFFNQRTARGNISSSLILKRPECNAVTRNLTFELTQNATCCGRIIGTGFWDMLQNHLLKQRTRQVCTPWKQISWNNHNSLKGTEHLTLMIYCTTAWEYVRRKFPFNLLHGYIIFYWWTKWISASSLGPVEMTIDLQVISCFLWANWNKVGR